MRPASGAAAPGAGRPAKRGLEPEAAAPPPAGRSSTPTSPPMARARRRGRWPGPGPRRRGRRGPRRPGRRPRRCARGRLARRRGRCPRTREPQAAGLGHLGGDQDAARLGELHGVAGEVEQDLAQPALVGVDLPPAAAGAAQAISRPFSRARGDSSSATPRSRPSSSIGRRVQLDAPGAQLGEVEHVVDQGEQVLAAVVQGRDIGPLLGGELGALQQPRHAQHAVQRRAEFVAERGQLLRADLGAVGPALGKGAERSAHGAQGLGARP